MEEFSIKIPDDISIIGFDDLPLSNLMTPALTTMQVSKKEIGKISMTLLDDMLTNKGNTPIKKVLINGKLICRDSVKSL